MTEPKTYPLSELTTLKLDRINAKMENTVLRMRELEREHAAMVEQSKALKVEGEALMAKALEDLGLDKDASHYIFNIAKSCIEVQPKVEQMPAPAEEPQKKRKRA